MWCCAVLTVLCTGRQVTECVVLCCTVLTVLCTGRQVTECVVLCCTVLTAVLTVLCTGRQVTECVVRGLHDERVEVRQMAVQVFSGLLHCGFIDRARQQQLRVSNITPYSGTSVAADIIALLPGRVRVVNWSPHSDDQTMKCLGVIMNTILICWPIFHFSSLSLVAIMSMFFFVR